jgi:hypothetical protein
LGLAGIGHAGGFLQRVAAAACEGHAVAVVEQRERRRTAHAAAGAGDHGETLGHLDASLRSLLTYRYTNRAVPQLSP